MTLFFRSELRAIKETQGIQDLKQDKVLTQLQGMEELMYFALIMLKRISPQDPSDPPVTRPTAAAATISAQPEPSEAPPAQPEIDVATDLLEEDQEPPIAIATKKNKKKAKKN